MAGRTVQAKAYNLSVSGLQVGVSFGAELSTMTTTVRNAALADMASIGFSSVRFELTREAVETSQGVFTYTQYDATVAAIVAHGLTPMPVVAYTPAWARTGGTFSSPPNSVTLWGNFWTALVTHYAPLGIHNWEVWNEPNISLFWGGGATSPTTYYSLLSSAKTAIRAVDSTAYIISAGLSPAATSGNDTSPLDFLASMISSGITSLGINAVGWHPYSFPAFVTDVEPWSAWSQMFDNGTGTAVDLLNTAGSSLPLWLTEYGCPTGGPGTLGTRANRLSGTSYDHMDQDCQAQMATDCVAALRANSRFAGLHWYSYQDLGTSTTDPQNFYGFIDFGGTHKTAYAALATAI